MLAGGVGKAKEFEWLEKPKEDALKHAERLLTDLGSVSSADGEITEIGNRMATFPMHPRYAKMLLD
ncbi:MAG: hypothetical protein VW879_15905, partial [Opitutae bacterium]